MTPEYFVEFSALAKTLGWNLRQLDNSGNQFSIMAVSTEAQAVRDDINMSFVGKDAWDYVKSYLHEQHLLGMLEGLLEDSADTMIVQWTQAFSKSKVAGNGNDNGGG